MFYVEWLRVRSCLRILAIVLGVLFAVAVVVRISVGSPAAQYNWIYAEAGKPGVHLVQQRQSDGSLRTTIDDPAKREHIVIVDRGWQGKEITISGPEVDTSDSTGHSVQIGSLGVHVLHNVAQRVRQHLTSGSGVVQINTDEPVSARVLLFLATWVGVIIATFLAAPLTQENSNHLEVAWTKPVSRTRMALGMFGVDALGIIISMALAIVFALAATALFEIPHIVIDAPTLPVLALCVLMPTAWYALLTAAAASLKRGRGAVLGLGWLAALFVPGLAVALNLSQLPVFHVFGAVFNVLTLLDPIAYVHTSISSGPGNGEPSVGVAFGVLSAPSIVRAGILLLLSIVYFAIALLQWRRLEA